MKRFFTIIVLLTAFAHSVRSVAQENSMDLTVRELYDDLQTYRTNLEHNISQYEEQRADCWEQLNTCMHECQEYSIVLYTQQGNRLFSLSQACQNLEDLIEDFRKRQQPFEKWESTFDSDMDRYNRLEDLLNRIDTLSLTDAGKQARLECTRLCSETKERLNEFSEQIASNDELYESVASRMSEMVEYNTGKFESIRHDVFMSGGDSYFKILGHFGTNFRNVIEDISTQETANAPKESTIRENIVVMLTMGGIALLSVAVAFLMMTVFLPARFRKEGILRKKGFFIASIAVTLFLILAAIAGKMFFSGYGIFPSVELFLYGMIIIDVFLISAALRFDAATARSTFRCYIPILLTAFVFICERLLLVSNNVINLTIPPLLLASFVWQLLSLIRHGHFEERFSAVTLWLTCIITATMCLLSWIGFSFLALMLIIYWIVQLTCLQAITCVNYLVRHRTRVKDDKSTMRELWLTPTAEKLVLPLMTIASFSLSLRWAAQMFSMRSWAEGVLHNNFAVAISEGSKINVSISSVLFLIALAFVQVWIIHMVKTALKVIYKENYATGAIPLYVTLGSILAWLLYAVVFTKVLNIDSNALVAAVGGLGVGLGFALKDTINDLLCGLTLLMGRVHLNDYIECDGIRGRITEVGIRSTTIDTLDGSTMSFLNSQLFAKNFKNLTKSNHYELCAIPIGVSYGTDVEKARKVILEALEPMRDRLSGKEPKVLLSGFGDNSVDLIVRAWVRDDTKASQMAEIRETIYKAFNSAGIEIPFPQRDVHIINEK